MPKSDSLPLRRWPCCPGPYSRLLTGLLGRPQMFSPIRRSILCFADARLVIEVSPKSFQNRTTAKAAQMKLALLCRSPGQQNLAIHRQARKRRPNGLREAPLVVPARDVKLDRPKPPSFRWTGPEYRENQHRC